MSKRGFPLRRIAGFVALPLLSAIAPLVVLPVLVRTVGAEGWAAIAVGMSIGAAGSILVNFAWGVTGPPSVAPQTPAQAFATYRTSLIMRIVISVPTSLIVFILAELLSVESGSAAAGLIAVATALGGLSPAWFFIGRGQPAGVAIWDTLPRLLASVITIPAILVFPSSDTYGVVSIVVFLCFWVPGGFLLARRRERISWEGERSAIVDAFRDQTMLVGSSLVSGAYTSLGVALVSVVNYPAVAAFAAGDRLRAMGKQGEMAVTNGLQGWVASAPREGGVRRRRMTRALSLMTVVGFVALVGFALGLPQASRIIFGPEIEISVWLGVWVGAALLFTAVSMSCSFHVLAPERRLRQIAIATTVGAVFGVPAILWGASLYGAVGAAAGLAIAELVVVAIELPYVLVVIRSLPGHGLDEPSDIA